MTSGTRMTGPVGYWHVGGGGGGKLTATVTDADGNLIGLLQAPR